MTLRILPDNLTICKVSSITDIDFSSCLYFVGRTSEEISLVCRREDTPLNTTEREDGWRAFYVEGPLDFSLTGVLSKISTVLAENGIPIFAVSTFNTDYILVKAEKREEAMEALENAGYECNPAIYDSFRPQTCGDLISRILVFVS